MTPINPENIKREAKRLKKAPPKIGVPVMTHTQHLHKLARDAGFDNFEHLSRVWTAHHTPKQGH